MPTDQAVEAHWAALGAMDRAALRVAWTGAFGAAPPHHLSMAFLRKALIWHEQCRRAGGGSPDLKRVLKAGAAGKSGAGGGATGPRPGVDAFDSTPYELFLHMLETGWELVVAYKGLHARSSQDKSRGVW